MTKPERRTDRAWLVARLAIEKEWVVRRRIVVALGESSPAKPSGRDSGRWRRWPGIRRPIWTNSIGNGVG